MNIDQLTEVYTERQKTRNRQQHSIGEKSKIKESTLSDFKSNQTSSLNNQDRVVLVK